MTFDCVATPSSSATLKFADDATVLGLISNNDETFYREEVRVLETRCQDYNLSLNVCKTKEMMIDFRKTMLLKNNEMSHGPVVSDYLDCFWNIFISRKDLLHQRT